MQDKISHIIEAVRSSPQYVQAAASCDGGGRVAVNGLPPVMQAVFARCLRLDKGGPLLLLAATPEEAQALYENIMALGGEETELFAPLELLPFEVYAQNAQVAAGRVRVLSRLSSGEPLLVVSCVSAVWRCLPPPEVFASFHLTLKQGSSYDLQELLAFLHAAGYRREKQVEEPGVFSLRGGILDVFSPNMGNPLRLDFFDDVLESLRVFDAESQRSGEALPEARLIPARETPLDRQAFARAREKLAAELEKTAAALSGSAARQLNATYAPLLELLAEGGWETAMEQFACYFYPEAALLTDYFSRGQIVLAEPAGIKKEFAELAQTLEARYGELLAAGRILPSFWDNFRLFEDLRERLRGRSLLLLAQLPQTDDWETARQIELPVREAPAYHNNKNTLAEDLRSFKRQKMRVFFAASNPLRLSRLEEIIRELDFPGVELLLCAFSKGFVSADLSLAVITEKELLGQEARRAARRSAPKGERIDNFLDLRQGDFVVHINHGVGRYLGVERLLVGDTQRDYLYIQYAGEDKLFLPVDQLDLIHKYIGNENAPPKLYRLGGGEWQRVKAKVSREIQDIAKELLQLYAAREANPGHSFAPDSHWQREFEDSFPFEETADQLNAMEEIKADMENARPMDRLLCGDVGYGKTELAVRAAFKAVMDGKQAAMLAPTTVLAEQHYRTFSQRFAGYPVAIGVLSRFLGPREQKLLLGKLKEGGLDIVIGTHRLLSQDVKYHDLGLLIVDEEQRFGVSHKEKIKKMKTNLDVLTLSATPIPRTLHMSLVGMRDMSLIATPPQDRHPVQTYVLEYQERLIKDALNHELKRGGQAYFVHNKVYNIERTAERLQTLLPEARILTAHGQMREKELEQVMRDFVAGEADILVCTTIVESGLDIPNVNTLIVDEADNFGLAQLYQLRGRVGRSDRQAFAYFTYRSNRIMNETAKKRLIAIRDFTELGSGFKIAMRDMEIRGAGNILGAEQHGHIAAVGFDLYCRLVQEEIEAQKGREPQDKEPVTLLELQVNAYTPDSYIDDMGLKLNIYKRIAAAPSLQYIDDLKAELAERCGPPPKTVENLLELGKIKFLAQRLFVASVIQKPAFLELKFAPRHPLSGEILRELAVNWNKRIVFSKKEDFVIRLKTDAGTPGEPMASLLEFLSSLAGLCGVLAES